MEVNCTEPIPSVSIPCMYQSSEEVPKKISTEIMLSLTFPKPFWQLDWPVKWKRPDLRELISDCSAANTVILLRSWNNKQYYSLKILFPIFMTHLLYLNRRWINALHRLEIFAIDKGSSLSFYTSVSDKRVMALTPDAELSSRKRWGFLVSKL